MKAKYLYKGGYPESVWKIAIRDVADGVGDVQLWMFLGWQDIRQRYRRSVLGPLWLTISTGIMVTVLSILYSRLFNLPVDIYIPYFVSGIIIWNLISSLLSDGCNTFTDVDTLIKQVRMPLMLHVCRMVWRNLIIFFHNLIILVLVWCYLHKGVTLINLFECAIALLLIAVNGLWVGMLLGAFCSRYRDIGQIVTNLIQVVFFITPIMWMPSLLKNKGVALWILVINPFYHFIEIFRAPLLGHALPITSWIIAIGITLAGLTLTTSIIGYYRNRIPYWL